MPRCSRTLAIPSAVASSHQSERSVSMMMRSGALPGVVVVLVIVVVVVVVAVAPAPDAAVAAANPARPAVLSTMTSTKTGTHGAAKPRRRPSASVDGSAAMRLMIRRSLRCRWMGLVAVEDVPGRPLDGVVLHGRPNVHSATPPSADRGCGSGARWSPSRAGPARRRRIALNSASDGAGTLPVNPPIG